MEILEFPTLPWFLIERTQVLRDAGSESEHDMQLTKTYPLIQEGTA